MSYYPGRYLIRNKKDPEYKTMNKNINLKPLLAKSDLSEPSDILIATQASKSATPHPHHVTRKTQHATRNSQPVTRTPQPDHCFSVDLGTIDYNEAWKLQSELVAAKVNNSIEKDIILFLEHPAVFTLGRRGGRDYLLVGESFLEQSSIPVVQVERGGYITFHGPGQLVVYTIIDLEARRLGVTDFVTALEEIMLQTVRDLGLKAQRNTVNPGIWLGQRKMGSIGIALRKGISFHGLSLNVNVDLTPFSWIQPCGLQGVSMTSVSQELGKEIPMAAVHRAVKEGFKSVLNLKLNDISYPDLQQQFRPGNPN
jgi:lipoate-protein ligase B